MIGFSDRGYHCSNNDHAYCGDGNCRCACHARMCPACRGKGNYPGLDITCRRCNGSGLERLHQSNCAASPDHYGDCNDGIGEVPQPTTPADDPDQPATGERWESCCRRLLERTMTWTSSVDYAAVYAMRKGGAIYAAIAAHFGITTERARQICVQQATVEAMREQYESVKQLPSDQVRIDQVLLSVRTYNGLRRLGIATVAEVAALTERELLATKNIGKRSLAEIRGLLEVFGLKLKEPPPPTAITSNADFCPTCGAYRGVRN